MSIYRIHFSENDIGQLEGKAPPRSLKDEVDFSKVIVDKPWGYESLLYRNSFADVWNLVIREGEITSMHCHPNKKTGLLVLEGDAVFTTLNTSIRLRPGDGVMIDAGAFHSTRATSPGGVRVLEIETPPLKYDLIRLKDEYGRAGTFYEAANRMRIAEDGCARFAEPAPAGFEERQLGEGRLCLCKIRNTYGSDDSARLRAYDVIVVLEGTIYSKRGHILHGVADLVPQSDFLNNLTSHVLYDLTLLLVNARHA